MKTELVNISPTRKEIKIEIEPEAVRQAYDRVSDQYAKHATVPGFRRGRAPRSVVRTRYKDEIRSQVLRELVPQAIEDAITQSALDVIGEPHIHEDKIEGLDNLGEQPISLEVHVEVMPKVELGEFRGVEATRRVRPVTDEEVEEVIKNLREASASLQPVEDRPSQEGDTVTANFVGKFVNEPEAEPINVEDVDVVIGGEGVQPEFSENLTGVRPDDERTFTVSYPADFSAQGLAGKELEYTAKVAAVRRKELPELDDEWARSIGDEYESVAVLREKIREDLQQRANAESGARLRNEVLNKLIEAHPFEVPSTLVEHQANHRLQSFVQEMRGSGLDPRQYREFDWQGMREHFKTQAEQDVRGSMLLESIAESENITVADEEIEQEINRLAEASRQTPEKVRDALTKQGGERSIADRLRNRKALDLLVENARVTDAEWQEETPDETESEVDQSTATGETPVDQSGEEQDAAQAQSSSPEA